MGGNIFKQESYSIYKRREILQNLMYMGIRCTDECIMYVLFNLSIYFTGLRAPTILHTVKVLL